jgi:HK97 family phage portal protein
LGHYFSELGGDNLNFFKNLFRKKEYRTVETVEVDEHLRQVMGLVTDTQTALNIPAVSACVDFISNKIAELPIKLYRESDGKTTEITHDFRLSLLNDSTGDLLDTYQMKSAFVRDYLLHGAGYIFPERNKNEFVSLRYIANENVTVTKNYDPIYKLARYQIGTRTFFDDEIMRICRNTKDGVTGVGIIQEHADILNAAYKQIVYERYLVERGGNKKGFIQVDDRVTQEVLDDLKEKWQTLYSSDNSNMMVLNKGLKFVESSNTSVEMQLNESKDTNNELICQMFGLSSKVISGTASDEEYISAIKTAVMPIVAAIQTALNKSLLLWAEKSDHYFILDTKELLKGDILKRYQAYQIALHEGFLQVDEVRYEEDREPFNLNWIKLGLQDVLFDTKNHTIYTPNTNQTVKFGEFSIDKQDDSGIMETRYNRN